MRVVTYDIHFGWGLDGRVDLERIARSLRDADIIALQEVERFRRRSAMTDPPGRAPQRGMRLDRPGRRRLRPPALLGRVRRTLTAQLPR